MRLNNHICTSFFENKISWSTQMISAHSQYKFIKFDKILGMFVKELQLCCFRAAEYEEVSKKQPSKI